MKMKLFCVAFTLGSLVSCTESKKAYNEYIHVAHTRMWDTIQQKLDPRIEAIDYSQYDLVLLGGDLTEESSKERKTLIYLDSVFNLSSPNTLWALGNHDNAHLDWVEATTGRKYYNHYHKDGITYVVLYTQEKEDWICTITGDQRRMLDQVADTISSSSHLIIMTHKLIWIKDHPELAEHQGVKAYDWSCNYQIHSNDWMTGILPQLQKVQERGVQVIALAGDIGNNVDQFEERTKDSIYYLASGINCDNENSKYLTFTHDVEKGQLSWKFENLNRDNITSTIPASH